MTVQAQSGRWPWIGGLLFASTVAGAAWVLWRPSSSFYAYNVPIAVPFALFVWERWVAFSARVGWWLAIDVAVVVLALSRVVYATPWISGHALFLAYALFTAETRSSRAASLLVLAQVLFMKLVLWHDYATPTGALLIAIAAAAARRRGVDRAR